MRRSRPQKSLPRSTRLANTALLAESGRPLGAFIELERSQSTFSGPDGSEIVQDEAWKADYDEEVRNMEFLIEQH